MQDASQCADGSIREWVCLDRREGALSEHGGPDAGDNDGGDVHRQLEPMQRQAQMERVQQGREETHTKRNTETKKRSNTVTKETQKHSNTETQRRLSDVHRNVRTLNPTARPTVERGKSWGEGSRVVEEERKGEGHKGRGKMMKEASWTVRECTHRSCKS